MGTVRASSHGMLLLGQLRRRALKKHPARTRRASARRYCLPLMRDRRGDEADQQGQGSQDPPKPPSPSADGDATLPLEDEDFIANDEDDDVGILWSSSSWPRPEKEPQGARPQVQSAQAQRPCRSGRGRREEAARDWLSIIYDPRETARRSSGRITTAQTTATRRSRSSTRT